MSCETVEREEIGVSDEGRYLSGYPGIIKTKYSLVVCTGPYDPRLPGSASVINWFCVSDLVDDRGHPKRLTYDLLESTEVTQEEGDRLVGSARYFDY